MVALNTTYIFMTQLYYAAAYCSRIVFLMVFLGMTAPSFSQVHLVTDLKPGGKSGQPRFFKLNKSDGTRAFFVADDRI
jgi:hypothetical protein